MYSMPITKLLAVFDQRHTCGSCQNVLVPRSGSMRRKIARAVDGCWYRRLKVVPGSDSRYSKEPRDTADMISYPIETIGYSVSPIDHNQYGYSLPLVFGTQGYELCCR
jgi:hypothetical protein